MLKRNSFLLSSGNRERCGIAPERSRNRGPLNEICLERCVTQNLEAAGLIGCGCTKEARRF